MAGASAKDVQLLIESAPLAFAYAKSNCALISDSNQRCDWYHGIWQCLRILDLVGSPLREEYFFKDTLGPLAETGHYNRILISGSSDYGMLSVLDRIYSDVRQKPQVTVVDHCETPLFLNRWYGERFGVDVTTCCSDMLGYVTQHDYDLICTHSFFGNFPHQERGDLIRNWFKLLRPGGKVVTVNRIRPGIEEEQHFTNKQKQDFVARLQNAVNDEIADINISLSELTTLAQTYVEHYKTYPVCSHTELLNLFSDAGFSLERTDTQGRHTLGSPPPSINGEALRLYLVAARSLL